MLGGVPNHETCVDLVARVFIDLFIIPLPSHITAVKAAEYMEIVRTWPRPKDR